MRLFAVCAIDMVGEFDFNACSMAYPYSDFQDPLAPSEHLTKPKSIIVLSLQMDHSKCQGEKEEEAAMKIFILAFETGLGGDLSTHQTLVKSPEYAAIQLWEGTKSAVDPSAVEAALYEVDLGEETVQKINIPKMRFE